MAHWERDVTLAVNEARGQRDRGLRDDLFYEHDAAAEFAVTFTTNIEAKICLFKLRVERHGDLAPEFCLAKAKADEADVGFATEGIQRGS